jgi:hypothetical protein
LTWTLLRGRLARPELIGAIITHRLSDSLGMGRTRWPELLVGLERVEVLEVARGTDGRLHVAVETTDRDWPVPAAGAEPG